jgi:mRNA interferase YafQ
MKTIRRTTAFKKQYRKLRQAGYKMELLDQAIKEIFNQDHTALKRMLDHPTQGKYKGDREVHIKGDWLLRYRVEKDRLVLVLLATGTHRDVLGIE